MRSPRGLARVALAALLGSVLAFSAMPAHAATDPPPFLRAWGSYGTADGEFVTPYGVAVDPTSGAVYVAELASHRVQKFDADGTHLATWGGSGTGAGQFNAPGGVAVDADGNVYVTEGGNHRVQKFSADGTHLATWGEPGSGDGQFNSPIGIAVNDTTDDVYVVDTWNHRVQQFTTAGAYVGQWGTIGTGNGEFTTPQGIAVDTDGNVYVTDTPNNRVQKFTASGGYLTQWGTSGAGDGELNGPVGVGVGTDGNVYVADYYNDRVQAFSSTGTFLTRWGGSGNGNGQFVNPTGLAVAGGGNVYVTDAGNHRVQAFGTPTDTTDPTVDLLTPAEGAVYARDQVVDAAYTCADDAAGDSGVATCVAVPDVASGSPIDTSTLGDHELAVTATDNAVPTAHTTTVTHTYTVALARPDGRIQRGATRLYGNNTYNTLTGQTATGTATPGHTVTYYASIQNDAPFPDTLTLKGAGSTTRFTVTYRDPTNHNITNQVTAGTYTTPTLAPGATHRIRITVTIRPTAPAGSTLTRTLKATSDTHPTMTDTVRATTRRT